MQVDVFNKLVKLEAALRASNRVEIYRAITYDPTTVPRGDGVGCDDE